MDWINQALGREKWCTEHGNEIWLLKNVRELLTSLELISFSKTALLLDVHQ
jgi:hypothetical protein